MISTMSYYSATYYYIYINVNVNREFYVQIYKDTTITLKPWCKHLQRSRILIFNYAFSGYTERERERKQTSARYTYVAQELAADSSN